MKQNKLILVAAVLVAVFSITFAGRQKGNTGTTSAPPASWQTTTLLENWNYAVLPTTITACGTTFPQSYGSNTCPTLISQTTTSNNYYALITVESLESSASSDRKTFCRSTVGQTTIQVPQNHNYRITVDFVEKCSSCMQGNLGVPFPGTRRITWQAKQEYTRYTMYPTARYYYMGLRSC